MTGTSPPALIRSYYDTLDDHTYDRLRDLLAPDFVHERPDRTLKGRERFVTFMREERPQTATTHPIETIYTERCEDDNGVREFAARGRLVTEDGALITGFVDVFTLADGQIERLRTYTD